MRQYSAKTILGLLAALTIASTASAQQGPPCGPRDKMVGVLADKYGEQLISFGHTGPLIFETYANSDTGTWTIIRTEPNGRSCLLTAGDEYHAIKPEPKGEGI